LPQTKGREREGREGKKKKGFSKGRALQNHKGDAYGKGGGGSLTGGLEKGGNLRHGAAITTVDLKERR